jgi:hypothetical protein
MTLAGEYGEHGFDGVGVVLDNQNTVAVRHVRRPCAVGRICIHGHPSPLTGVTRPAQRSRSKCVGYSP